MHRVKSIIVDLLLLFIITAPAFIRILNNQYFSIHDDQHIARLFLLDQGLKQGYLYPRWVDGLGFGFGYPLYNFYPPLIYYIGEFFHLLGFSLIWSVKLIFILGFYLGALGIYLLVKKLTNRLAGLVSATLYTYFFYHAVLMYVRGALAEFFSLAILPFLFLTLDNLAEKVNWRNAIYFGVTLALLILCHPLIALPTMIFLGLFFIFYLLNSKLRFKFIYFFTCSLLIGLSLSAFFWLPSMLERKFTLTDKILTGELASYKLHYIYPQQFIYSPWGYGGSGIGLSDGMTFQLGKIHIGLAILSLTLFFISFFKNKKLNTSTSYFLLTTFLLVFSLFMTTEYSAFIWDRVKYLWYLQFPWRFLTFTTIFISMVGGFLTYFLFNLLIQTVAFERLNRLYSIKKYDLSINRLIMFLLSFVIVVFTVFTYQKYFKPQRYIQTNDKERTSFEEISWRISRTSYEFVPKEVKTKKTELNTTILDIDWEDLPTKSYFIYNNKVKINEVKNNFNKKIYTTNSEMPFLFNLNTYDFPGWTAYIDNKKTSILNNNGLKLIVINVPEGNHKLEFIFEDTPVRQMGNIVSILSLAIFLLFSLSQFKKVDG